MIRKIIKIDEEKCNGCGLCAKACHEGAIGMVNGKAKLLREDYCDGLGDCLPACPTGAIRFEEREAPAYDEAAVRAAQRAKAEKIPAGCPGMQSKFFARQPQASSVPPADNCASELSNWPVQIKLAPVTARYFEGAKLLIAADCTAFAYGAFHRDFIKGTVALIGCPKLDEGDYAEKLTEIIRRNNLKSVHVVRMEVPCCGGIENAVKRALQQSGKFLPWKVTVLSVNGGVLSES